MVLFSVVVFFRSGAAGQGPLLDWFGDFHNNYLLNQKIFFCRGIFFFGRNRESGAIGNVWLVRSFLFFCCCWRVEEKKVWTKQDKEWCTEQQI